MTANKKCHMTWGAALTDKKLHLHKCRKRGKHKRHVCNCGKEKQP